MQKNEALRHVFRDRLEEDRGSYIVSYQPADARSPYAILNLVYPGKPDEVPAIVKNMESELERWLKRYPVPVKISAFDSDEQLVRLSAIPSENYLMGYVRPWDEAIVRRWAILEERELPSEQRTPEYLENAYKGVAFRVRAEDRLKVRRQFWGRVKSLCLIASFILVLPLLIQAIQHGGPWFVVLLTAASVAIGGYKLAVFMGWRKPSRWEQAKEEWNDRLYHYCYHCEANAAGFARLEAENFEREIIEETRRSAEKFAAGGHHDRARLPGFSAKLARRLPVFSQ